jgi:hypothetical protein
MSKLFDELRDLKKAYDKKLKDEGEAALKEAFKEVFDKHPRLRSIVWTQYTPYFNDGDPCYFRVHEFDVHITGVSYEGEDEEDDYSYGETLYTMKQSKEQDVLDIVKSIKALEKELPDDVLESVFGDHCKVVATAKGFDVDEYSHD